jgi:hypothetical protein
VTSSSRDSQWPEDNWRVDLDSAIARHDKNGRVNHKITVSKSNIKSQSSNPDRLSTKKKRIE